MLGHWRYDSNGCQSEPIPAVSSVKWAECFLIRGTDDRVQVFLLDPRHISRFVSRYSVYWRFGAWDAAQIRMLVSLEDDNWSTFDLKSIPCARASKLKQQICISPELGWTIRQWRQGGLKACSSQGLAIEFHFFYLILGSSVILWAVAPVTNMVYL